MEIRRDFYLDKLIRRKNNGLIKVITGIRRCGKSYLLNNIFYNHLLESGVPAKRYCTAAKQQMQIKYNSVPTLGLAGIKELLLYGYLWYHIREVFSFIGEFGGAICLNHQIRN